MKIQLGSIVKVYDWSYSRLVDGNSYVPPQCENNWLNRENKTLFIVIGEGNYPVRNFVIMHDSFEYKQNNLHLKELLTGKEIYINSDFVYLNNYKV
jgi:hypothetical protein